MKVYKQVKVVLLKLKMKAKVLWKDEFELWKVVQELWKILHLTFQSCWTLATFTTLQLCKVAKVAQSWSGRFPDGPCYMLHACRNFDFGTWGKWLLHRFFFWQIPASEGSGEGGSGHGMRKEQVPNQHYTVFWRHYYHLPSVANILIKTQQCLKECTNLYKSFTDGKAWFPAFWICFFHI